MSLPLRLVVAALLLSMQPVDAVGLPSSVCDIVLWPRTVEGISNVPPIQTTSASCNSCWPPQHQPLWGDLTCQGHLCVAYPDAWGCAVMPEPLYCHPPAVVTGHPDERMGNFGPEVRADALPPRGDLTA
eukprot:2116813-Amphidinium_carterae.1